MKILTSQEVQEGSGYGRVTIWRKSRDPNDDFPAPIQLGANRIGWIEDEFVAWLASRPRVAWASSGDVPSDPESVKDHSAARPSTSDPGQAAA
jgi:predicted DNA-binding transcriptional regulator AlpA